MSNLSFIFPNGRLLAPPGRGAGRSLNFFTLLSRSEENFSMFEMSGVHNRAKGVEWMLLEQRCDERVNAGAVYRDAGFRYAINHPTSRRVILLAHNSAVGLLIVIERRGGVNTALTSLAWKNNRGSSRALRLLWGDGASRRLLVPHGAPSTRPRHRAPSGILHHEVHGLQRHHLRS